MTTQQQQQQQPNNKKNLAITQQLNNIPTTKQQLSKIMGYYISVKGNCYNLLNISPEFN